MSDRNGISAACPDLEAVAAYVDGRVDAEERRAIEAHLATCEACYELMVETARVADGVPDQLGAPARPGPKRWVYGVSGLLAAAAAIVLMVWARGTPGGPSSAATLSELVAAVGPQRFTELRVSGGFEYGPLRSDPRGAPPADLRLSAAAAAAIGAASSGDAEAAHVSGIASLVTGRIDAAVRALEAACNRSPSARCETDLGAALFARAAQSGSAEDVNRALEHTRVALSLQAGQPEALFNEALILERLGRRAEARAAWDRYLEIDSSSEWAREARQRRAALAG
jgi:hypothetical protein